MQRKLYPSVFPLLLVLLGVVEVGLHLKFDPLLFFKAQVFVSLDHLAEKPLFFLPGPLQLLKQKDFLAPFVEEEHVDRGRVGDEEVLIKPPVFLVQNFQIRGLLLVL